MSNSFSRQLIAEYRAYIRPEVGDSSLLSERRDRAALVEGKIPFSGHKSLQISTTPKTQRRKQGALESIPPRTVWKRHRPLTLAV